MAPGLLASEQRRRLHALSRGTVLIAGVLAALPAWAQVAPADGPSPGAEPVDVVAEGPETAPVTAGARVYEPDYFTRFAPNTAADMVSNIPGFDISGGEDERGFGQASQNVLINGRRVSGKSNDAQTALGRINAASVIRIEIVDGATLDIPGLSGEVANVVAKVDALSGTWSVQPEFRRDLKPALYKGEVNLSGKAGGWSWSVGIEADEFENGNDGVGIISNNQGAVTDFRREAFTGSGQAPDVSATVTYETRAGSVANLNLSVGSFNFNGRNDSYRRPVGEPAENRFIFSGEDQIEGEIGADYDFALGPGRLKLIGLHSYAEEDDFSRLESYTAAGVTGQRVLAFAEAGESIGRAEYGFAAFGGDVQVAGEGAFNYLDLATEIATLQGGAYVGQVLADGTARVEEKRAEANLSLTRELSPAWNLQGSLGGEYSELSQTGAGGLTREFVRPKGFLSLAWTASPSMDVNFKIERRVGQLDFGDFLSSVDLQNNNAQSGNADLVPEQAWVGSSEINKKLGAWGAVKLTLEAQQIEDVVDLIPIGATGSGVGNVDTARTWSAGVSGTLNFDPIGLKGLQLSFESVVSDSEVDDPLTGEPREISGSDLYQGFASLRWDVPETPWSLVAGVEEYKGAANYRLDQIGRFWQAPSINFFSVEHKDILGMKMQLQVVNLNDTSENFKREVYQGGRRTNPLSFVEERYRTFGPIVRFSVSGTF